MTEHLRLIARHLAHLQRMREYLVYSTQRVQQIFPIDDWAALSFDQHEALAAFRVRFSEFQEHLGKTMRAVAIEEEVDVERFGSVLAFMEKLGVLESIERWKLIRELRNAVNHEYEDDTERLAQFFTELVKATPELFACHERLVVFCAKAYTIEP
ncbi:MAG: hypothetical protein AABY83_11120 [Pseudomonadota bacterium]